MVEFSNSQTTYRVDLITGDLQNRFPKGEWTHHAFIDIRARHSLQGGRNVGEGIEYDIVAHAPDLDGLPNAFTRAVLENACITEHLGRAPMEGIRLGMTIPKNPNWD